MAPACLQAEPERPRQRLVSAAYSNSLWPFHTYLPVDPVVGAPAHDKIRGNGQRHYLDQFSGHDHVKFGGSRLPAGRARATKVTACLRGTVHYTRYTVLCALCTIHCTLYTMHYTRYIVLCALCTIHGTLYSVHYTRYTALCVLCPIHGTLYSVHCALFSNTRYTVLCALCTVF